MTAVHQASHGSAYVQDGSTFWNRLSITHVTDSFSGTVRLIGVQSDITELIERRETARALLQERAAARAAQEVSSMRVV